MMKTKTMLTAMTVAAITAKAALMIRPKTTMTKMAAVVAASITGSCSGCDDGNDRDHDNGHTEGSSVAVIKGRDGGAFGFSLWHIHSFCFIGVFYVYSKLCLC